jgi:hypothetical protein
MEGFRELHNNTVPKKHDSQNNTSLNITPLMHVSDGLYIECPPRGGCESSHVGLSERELQVGGDAGRFGEAKLYVEGVAGSSRGFDCERQCRGGGGFQWRIREKACSYVSISFSPHVLGSHRR